MLFVCTFSDDEMDDDDDDDEMESEDAMDDSDEENTNQPAIMIRNNVNNIKYWMYLFVYIILYV
jgi:hypothetical protein